MIHTSTISTYTKLYVDIDLNIHSKSKPEFTLGIFLDLQKAFDCCALDILLKKIINYGFENDAIAPMVYTLSC